MKIIVLLIGIIASVSNFACLASADTTNAKLVNYIFGRYDYSFFLIIPDNIEEYTYLSHYPFTAFMFLYYYDEDKIANLTVKELKSLSLASADSCCASDALYDALKLDKLKGFEKFAEVLNRIDEFDIAARKKEIIYKLTEIYGRYKEDYRKYLRGYNGTYRFRKGKLRHSTWNRLKEYNENVEYNEPTTRSYYERLDIKDYDFDNKSFRIELLSPISKRSSNGWEYHYVRKFKDKYSHLKYRNNPILNSIDFPEEIQIPMPLKDAEKLFRDDLAHYETILTVKPEEGAFGYSGIAFFIMTSNFKILKVAKNYYKKENWSKEENKYVGDPVFTLELEPKEDMPFY
jgi:hypothetical protein